MNHSDILVSVVMPAFACADTIGQAVASVLLQQVPLELIIVVDGRCRALDMALEPFQQNGRVRILHNERNLGAAASRNRGIRLARGEYVAFVDADDIWAPGKLEKQLEALKKSGAVLCATSRELLRPDGTSTGITLPVPKRITYRRLLWHNCIACSSVVVRSDAVRRFPMRCEESHEDYILWLELLNAYGPACALREPLLRYRTGSTGKSGSKWRSAAMTYRVYGQVGFGRTASALLFARYALCGVLKYTLGYLRRKR
jgi:teichuronic acid biosynthesis glycosyltransferase TuaG